MAIPQFNSFRRYTPPTCTLEIYHPQPFWGRWRDKSFPPLFSFQLHFDDPRLARDDRISIIGDRNLLEKLRIKLQTYIDNYLNQSTISSEKLSCEISTTAITDADNIIHFSRQSTYSHFLYYQSFAPHTEILEVVLNNSQLLDLINALEAYHWEATQVKIIRAKKTVSPRLVLALFATLATFSGFWWWRDQQNDSLAMREQNISSTSENSTNNKFPAVIPPSPLDMEKVPETVVPEIPPELINQTTLSPPPIVAKTPNSSVSNQSNRTIISRNSQKQTNNSSSSPILNVPANNSSIQNQQSQTPIKAKQKQKISISPLTSLPVLSSANSPTNTPSPSSSSNEDKQNNITALSSSPPKNLSNDSLDNVNNNFFPNLEQNISSSNSPRKVGRNISAEVKQYFQGKWQVPEDLKQSIEYRLQVEENGRLSKVTPVGQVATIFLNQTPIPTNNEIITSPFTELPSVTVRLILSPNGTVQAFAE